MTEPLLTFLGAIAGNRSAEKRCRRWLQSEDWLNRASPVLHSFFPLIQNRLSLKSAKLAGVKRYYWLRSQRLENLGFQVKQILDDSGVSALATHDQALSRHYGRAERPLRWLSYWVTSGEPAQVKTVLEEQGFHCQPLRSCNGKIHSFKMQHCELVLLFHWNASTLCRWTQADNDVLRRASGESPAETDLLLLRVLDGQRETDAWWIVDALNLVKRELVDFTILEAQLHSWRRTELFKACLEPYLCYFPVSFQLRLSEFRSDIRESIEFQAWRIGLIRKFLCRHQSLRNLPKFFSDSLSRKLEGLSS